MRKLSAKWVPKCLNADQKRQRFQSSEQISEFFRLDPNDFLSGAIGDHGRNLVISLWPGDKATIIGVAALRLTPPPNFPSAKIRWKISALDFLESRRHPPHLLSSKGPNYQRGVLLISSGETEGHFEGKTPRKSHQVLLFLHENDPAHRSLTTQKKLPYLGFQCLDHPPYSPDLAPSAYHLFSGLKKKIERSPFFFRRGGHCCRWDLVGRTTFWFFFLSGVQKLEQRTKKCIELRGEYVE